MKSLVIIFGLLAVCCSGEIIPYHVHITIYDSMLYTMPGSGVIVTDKHILTTASNVYQFFKWDLGFGGDHKDTLTTQTSFKSYIHPQYNEETGENNLGIIELPQSLKYTSRISPVILPAAGSQFPDFGEQGFVGSFSHIKNGMNITNVLKKSVEKVIPTATCLSSYPHLAPVISDYFCIQGNVSMCSGTQGSGFTVVEQGRKVLAGLVSFGNQWEYCSENKPLAALRISKYMTWINHRISEI